MKRILLLSLIAISLVLSSCTKESNEYLFHFTSSYYCSSLDQSQTAVEEIQSMVDFDKIYTFTATRDKAIELAQAEYDKVIESITTDYSSYFGEGEFITISMEMFAPETYIVAKNTWGNK